MKNVVKSSKHFFGYFNALETHSDLPYLAFNQYLNKDLNRQFAYFIVEKFEICDGQFIL